MTDIINYRPDGVLTTGLQDFIAAIPPSRRGRMAQVGVWRGDGTLHFARAFQFVIDVDPWEGATGMDCTFEDVYDYYRSATGHLDNVIEYRMTSVEAVKYIADKSLDGAYIDAIHDFPHVSQDMRVWLPKIKDGGWIGGHDMIEKFPGVERAVLSFFAPEQVQRFTDTSWLVAL